MVFVEEEKNVEKPTMSLLRMRYLYGSQVNFVIYVAVIVMFLWALEAEDIQKCGGLEHKCNCINSTVDCSGRDISNWVTVTHLKKLDTDRFKTLNFSQINLACMPRFPHLYIEVLDLSLNKIARFQPYAFAVLENLKILDLSHNVLKIRFVILSKMEKLEELNLQDNQIPALGIHFHEKAPNLERINLSHNPLNESALEILSRLKKLKYVNLSYTNTEQLPKAFFDNLAQLIHLDLTGNNFKTIAAAIPASHHFSMKTLLLDGNPITILGNDENTFPNLNALETLSLSNMSKLETIRNSPFEQLQSLRSLYLARSPGLSKLSCSAFTNGKTYVLPQLEELHVHNLSLSEPYIRLNLQSNPKICDEYEHIFEDVLIHASIGVVSWLVLSFGIFVVLYVVWRKRQQAKAMQWYIQAEEEEALRKW